MTTVLQDGFTGVDDTPLASHSPDITPDGGGWQDPTSGGTLAGNRLTWQNGDAQVAYLEAKSSRGVISAGVEPTQIFASNDGLAFRVSDDGSTYFRVTVDGDGLVSLIAPSGVNLGSYQIPGYSGGVVPLAVTFYGPRIVVDAAGKLGAIEARSSENTGATKHGVYGDSSGGSPSYIDDFKLEVELDDSLPSGSYVLGPLADNGVTDWVAVEEGAYALWTGAEDADGVFERYDLGGGTVTYELSDTATEAGSRSLKLGGVAYSPTATDIVAVNVPNCFLRMRLTGATLPNLVAKLDRGITRNR